MTLPARTVPVLHVDSTRSGKMSAEWYKFFCETGITGPPGEPGPAGPQGPTGPQGATGPKGDTGDTGPAGSNGAPGATGSQGPQGIPGNDGATGPQGIQGIPGNDGAQGPQGIQGLTGDTGPQGNAGSQGIQGIQGIQGPAGTNGQGVPTGGTTNQVLAKSSAADYATQWVTPSSGGDPFLAKLRLSADITNATTTPTNLTGMSFAFEANSFYVVELFMLCTSAAATTGYGFAIDTSVAVTAVGLHFTHQLANTGTISGGSSLADNVATGVSSGVPAITVQNPVMGHGILISGANAGTAQFMFRPEVAASATCKAGSVIRIMKIS